jgi:hypothetical protein
LNLIVRPNLELRWASGSVRMMSLVEIAIFIALVTVAVALLA